MHVINAVNNHEVAEVARNTPDDDVCTAQVAKKDMEDHTANVVSSKMMELARLAISAS